MAEQILSEMCILLRKGKAADRIGAGICIEDAASAAQQKKAALLKRRSRE